MPQKYYYESHTGLDWGSVQAHQMLLNASRLGMEKTVDILEELYKGW